MRKDGVASCKMELPLKVSNGSVSIMVYMSLTNLAFLRHVTTSDGSVEETWGCVVVADASQFSGCCWTVAMVGHQRRNEVLLGYADSDEGRLILRF